MRAHDPDDGHPPTAGGDDRDPSSPSRSARARPRRCGQRRPPRKRAPGKRGLLGGLALGAAAMIAIALPGTGDAEAASGAGEWVKTAPLDDCDDTSCHARARHTAAWMPTVGEVLVASGDTAQRYDPAAETWAAAASPPEWISSSATALHNGEVLIDHLRYKPDTDEWRISSAIDNEGLPQVRTRLEDGRVLGSGGWGRDDALDDVWVHSSRAKLYDPDEDRVEATTDMINPRFYHASVRLKDGPFAGPHAGKVLVSGGQRQWSPVQISQRSAELYDPSTEAWVSVEPLQASRKRHAAVALEDGRALIVGGTSSEQAIVDMAGGGRGACPETEPQPQAEIYNPVAGVWTPTAPMPISACTTSARPSVAMLDDGRVLVLGQDPESWWANPAAAIYDPTEDAWSAWTQTADMVTQDRFTYTSTATLLGDRGTVLVAGGKDSNWDDMTAAELFRPGN